MSDLDKVKYALVGIREEIANEPLDGDLELAWERDVVALFTSEAKAEEYVERSKLITYSKFASWRYSGRQFRVNSLLVGCTDYEIVPWGGTPEIDPKPPVKKGNR